MGNRQADMLRDIGNDFIVGDRLEGAGRPLMRDIVFNNDNILRDILHPSGLAVAIDGGNIERFAFAFGKPGKYMFGSYNSHLRALENEPMPRERKRRIEQ
jgi:hypothetical protein